MDQEFVTTHSRLLQDPTDKFEVPLTSSQEIGWFSKIPIAINRQHISLNFLLMFVSLLSEMILESTSPQLRGS